MKNPSITKQDSFEQDAMTLRDYFAAKAMQGLLANPEWMAEYKGEKFIMQKEIIADVSFRIADALLTEREKTNNNENIDRFTED